MISSKLEEAIIKHRGVNGNIPVFALTNISLYEAMVNTAIAEINKSDEEDEHHVVRENNAEYTKMQQLVPLFKSIKNLINVRKHVPEQEFRWKIEPLIKLGKNLVDVERMIGNGKINNITQHSNQKNNSFDSTDESRSTKQNEIFDLLNNTEMSGGGFDVSDPNIEERIFDEIMDESDQEENVNQHAIDSDIESTVDSDIESTIDSDIESYIEPNVEPTVESDTNINTEEYNDDDIDQRWESINVNFDSLLDD